MPIVLKAKKFIRFRERTARSVWNSYYEIHRASLIDQKRKQFSMATWKRKLNKPGDEKNTFGFDNFKLFKLILSIFYGCIARCVRTGTLWSCQSDSVWWRQSDSTAIKVKVRYQHADIIGLMRIAIWPSIVVLSRRQSWMFSNKRSSSAPENRIQ